MIYNPLNIQTGGIVCVVSPIKAAKVPDFITVPAFTPTGQEGHRVLRWMVCGHTLPVGYTPADVAAHFAAVSVYGDGTAVMCRELEGRAVIESMRAAKDVYSRAVFPAVPNTTAIYAVRTESDVYALIVPDTGDASLIPAKRDDTYLSKLDAMVQGERGTKPETEAAAAAFRACVVQAMKDLDVMGALFQISEPAIPALQRAFHATAYAQKAQAVINLEASKMMHGAREATK